MTNEHSMNFLWKPMLRLNTEFRFNLNSNLLVRFFSSYTIFKLNSFDHISFDVMRSTKRFNIILTTEFFIILIRVQSPCIYIAHPSLIPHGILNLFVLIYGLVSPYLRFVHRIFSNNRDLF